MLHKQLVKRSAQWVVCTTALLCGAVAFAQTDAASFAVGRHFDKAPGALPKTVVPTKVTAHLDVDPYREQFSGDARYFVQVREPVDSITMHARGLAIVDARVRGIDAAPTVLVNDAANTVTFKLAAPLPPGEHELSLGFSGMIHERDEGLYRVAATGNKARKMLVTQMEPIGARDMLPNFDEPSFRTVWELSVTTHKRFSVVANMPIVSATPLDNDRVRTQFAPTPSMSSYLLALAVGEFDRLSETQDGIELSIYTQPGQRERARLAMQWTKEILSYLHNYFGVRYALPKLDQIAVPGRNGAMENWGLIAYSEDLLLIDPKSAAADAQYWAFNVIAHEIVHQWFGNLVTMAWWDDLWLNESFAQWLAFKTTQTLRPEWNVAARRADERESAMNLDVLASAKPIHRKVARDGEAFDSFDAISYEKGAAVLHMIERFVGEAAWRNALRDYLKSNQFGNAVANDLWDAASRLSGLRVDEFAQSWIAQSGFPLVAVSARCANGQQITRVEQSRFLLRAGYAPQQTWRINLRVGETDAAGSDIALIDRATEVEVGACDARVIADIGANGYFRVRYDDETFVRVLKSFATLSVVDQQRIMSDSWALAKADQGSPYRTLDAIAAVPLEASPDLWRHVTSIYSEIFELLRNSPELVRVHTHARRILLPKFKALGWDARSNESPELRSLRADMIGLLAEMGESGVIAEARRRFDARERDAKLFHPDIAGGIVIAVGIHASKDDWESLANMMTSDRYTALAWPLGHALSVARDIRVQRHAMNASITDRFPRNVSGRLLSNIAKNAGSDRAVWEFVQENKAILFERAGQWDKRSVFAAPLRGSRDVALAHVIRAAAERELDADTRAKTLDAVASVERNAWAFEAVSSKLRNIK